MPQNTFFSPTKSSINSKFFGLPTTCVINLATNNPKKAIVFGENGYKVDDFVPIVIEPTALTAHHLQAKGNHLGHRGLGTVS